MQVDYNYDIAVQIVNALASDNFKRIYDCAHAQVLAGVRWKLSRNLRNTSGMSISAIPTEQRGMKRAHQ
ncbi:hypothetical protein IH992_25425 [Candidatus Poribacteria bacterium]|nr:hypothetical protein [Candidatus Poribacteria bacterium]